MVFPLDRGPLTRFCTPPQDQPVDLCENETDVNDYYWEMNKDVHNRKIWTRAPLRPTVKCSRIEKCHVCNQWYFVHGCLSKDCQEKAMGGWYRERGNIGPHGRRYRGRKSECQRAQWQGT